MKGANNPLTEADLAANQHIIEAIQKYFTQDAILSEEVHSSRVDRAESPKGMDY